MSENHSEMLAQKIAAALDASKEPYVFSKKEVAEIQAILTLFRRFGALRWAGSYLLWGLVTVALVISNLERIKDFFK